MKHLRILIILFCVFSQNIYCQDFFKDTDSYLSDIAERTGFDKDKIVIVNSSERAFFDEVIENQLFTFYGIAYKSEIYSASGLKKSSCWGQFRDLCKGIDKAKDVVGDKKVENVSYLKDLVINPEKKTVIFIYLTDLRYRQIKNVINPVFDEIKDDPSYDYIVLSMDYSRIINH